MTLRQKRKSKTFINSKNKKYTIVDQADKWDAPEGWNQSEHAPFLLDQQGFTFITKFKAKFKRKG